ncbi:MAG: hypothetical protein JHC26_04700 [Thermofilum sp.]|jgi:hypothetical protein|uniref:hypothetical protein n=1 Tax=Thermofilum sp. TaxID=1961369 RepID=UPI00258C06C2|nr:hypothetical protein [Thermofilum sp.]MCI4408367.1 hypothetical protein [Thermofilum sp.]
MLVEIEYRGKEFHVHAKELQRGLDVDLPVIDGNLPAEGINTAFIDAVYVLVQRVSVDELVEIAGPLPKYVEDMLKDKKEVKVVFIYTKITEYMLAIRFLEEAQKQRGRFKGGPFSG